MENENQKTEFEAHPDEIDRPVTFVVSSDIGTVDTAETVATMLNSLVPTLTHTATVTDESRGVCDHVFSADSETVEMVMHLCANIAALSLAGGLEVRYWE